LYAFGQPIISLCYTSQCRTDGSRSGLDKPRRGMDGTGTLVVWCGTGRLARCCATRCAARFCAAGRALTAPRRAPSAFADRRQRAYAWRHQRLLPPPCLRYCLLCPPCYSAAAGRRALLRRQQTWRDAEEAQNSIATLEETAASRRREGQRHFTPAEKAIPCRLAGGGRKRRGRGGGGEEEGERAAAGRAATGVPGCTPL